MSDKHEPFSKNYDKEQQKHYEREVRLEHGPDLVNQSVQNWNSYSEAEKENIMEEGNQIYRDFVKAIEANKRHDSKEVTEILERWHQHIRYFYEPNIDLLRGLGMTYNTNPDFIANFQKMHEDLPAFLEQAIGYYVDELETAELERMLADDEAMHQRQSRLSS